MVEHRTDNAATRVRFPTLPPLKYEVDDLAGDYDGRNRSLVMGY